MITLYILVGFFFLYGATVTVALVNQVKRVNKLERITNSVVATFEDIKNTIDSSEDLLDNPELKLAFSHDDQVGDFFKNLKSIQEMLKPYTEVLSNEE